MTNKSDVPKTFDGEYYNKDYFVTPEGKKYKGSNGKVHGWSYGNETGDWDGAYHITKAWKEVFGCKTLLDVGAGRGVFIAYARNQGIEAVGFDYSEYAVNEGRFIKCEKSWLIEHDATKRWPYVDDSVDLVVALDFYEHIYDDIPLLSNDIRSLIGLKCYKCSIERDGLCPLKNVVEFGEKDKELLEKTQSTEKNHLSTQESGERARLPLTQKDIKKSRERLENAPTKNLNRTPKNSQTVEPQTQSECVNGEKITPKKSGLLVKEDMTNVWRTSKTTRRNIKSFWSSNEEIIKKVQPEKDGDLLNQKEDAVRIVDKKIQELLKSIMLTDEETKKMVGSANQIGVNCDFCVPTVIRLCTSDVDAVISEMFRVAEKYIFLEIATIGSGGLQGERGAEGYVLKKGEPVPEELEGMAVAGHVTVQSEAWWMERLEHDDWVRRRDMENHFISLCPEGVLANWVQNSIIVLEKMD